MTIFKGTTGPDRIDLRADSQVSWIDAAEGDDLVYLSNNQAYETGPGADTVFGGGASALMIWRALPEKVQVDFERGLILNDGFGQTDSISGFAMINAIAPVDAYGDGSSNVFALNAPNSSADGRGGIDTAWLPNPIKDYTIRFEGSTILIDLKDGGGGYRFTSIEAFSFAGKYIDLKRAANDRSAEYFAEGQTLYQGLGAIYDDFALRGRYPSLSDAVIEDFTGDGKPDILFTMSQDQIPGTVTDAPTPNRLIIFSADDGGHWTDVTSQVLRSGQLASLSGMVRQNKTADLNGDGRIDVAWSVNQEDGRSGSSDNTSITNILLSDPTTGRYSIEPIGPRNWFHSVAVAPMVKVDERIHPGLVIAAGFNGPAVSVSVSPNQGLALENRLEGLSGGAMEYLGFLDRSSSADRYFFSDLSLNGFSNPGVIKRDSSGQWSIAASVDLGRTKDAIEIGFTSWQGSVGTIKVFPYRDFLITGGSTTAAKTFQLFPDQQALIVSKFETSVITKEQAAKGSIDQNESRPADFLEFFSIDKQSIKPAKVAVKGERPLDHYNFMDVLDFNRDGYQDLVVYPFNAGNSPYWIVYLNDMNGGLVEAGIDYYLPEPLGNRDATSALFDANQDGLWDLLTYPSGPITSSGADNAAAFKVYLGKQAFFTGPNFSNPALLGAPGFNEAFYLSTHPEVAALVQSGAYASGLAHYLTVGRAKGYVSFAVHAWVHGHDQADRIILREGDERAFGYEGDDAIMGARGNDSIDGGDGIDTAIFEKAKSAYKTVRFIQDNATVWKVTDLATGEVDELRHIEKLEFAKTQLAGSIAVQTEVSLDIDGTPAVAYRLYRAAFARDPDLAGLGYWIDILGKTYDPALAPDQNQVLLDSARDFVGSSEFKSIYGDNVSNASYVLNLYKNTLGRDPLAPNPSTGKPYDEAGYRYWLSVLDGGYTSRQHMFVFFSESSENKAAVAPIIETGVEYIPFQVPPGT